MAAHTGLSCPTNPFPHSSAGQPDRRVKRIRGDRPLTQIWTTVLSYRGYIVIIPNGSQAAAATFLPPRIGNRQLGIGNRGKQGGGVHRASWHERGLRHPAGVLRPAGRSGGATRSRALAAWAVHRTPLPSPSRKRGCRPVNRARRCLNHRTTPSHLRVGSGRGWGRCHRRTGSVPSPGFARPVWRTPNRANPSSPASGRGGPVLVEAHGVHLPLWGRKQVRASPRTPRSGDLGDETFGPAREGCKRGPNPGMKRAQPVRTAPSFPFSRSGRSPGEPGCS